MIQSEHTSVQERPSPSPYAAKLIRIVKDWCGLKTNQEAMDFLETNAGYTARLKEAIAVDQDVNHWDKYYVDAAGLSFDLTLVDRGMRHKAVEDFNRTKDVESFLCYINNPHRLAFTANNWLELKAIGQYEIAMVSSYSATWTNFHTWSLSALNTLFMQCDREVLRRLRPLPPGLVFTLYRGVSGTGLQRHVSGMSWTRDLEKAQWYARRYRRADPAVYMTRVQASDVIYYSNEREEDDFILFTKYYLRLPADSKKSRILAIA